MVFPAPSSVVFRMRRGTLMRAGAIHASLSRRARAFLTVSLPTDNLCPSSRSPGRMLTRLPLRIICLILLATVSTNEDAGNEVILFYIRTALREFESIVGIGSAAKFSVNVLVAVSCWNSVI